MNYLTLLFILFTIVWVIHAEMKPGRRIRIWKGKGRTENHKRDRKELTAFL